MHWLFLGGSATELGVEVDGLAVRIRAQDAEAAGKALLHLGGESLILGGSDMLQLAESAVVLRVGPAQIWVTRSGRRIVGAQEAAQVYTVGTLIIQLDEQIAPELVLDAKIPFLHRWSFDVARDSVLVRGRRRGRIESLEEGLSRTKGDAGIQGGQVVRHGEGPATARIAPFPGEVRVVEDSERGTDDGLVSQAIGKPDARREVAVTRIGNLGPHIRPLARNRVGGSPKQLAGERVESAQTAPDMMRPLVVFPAQAQIEGQFVGDLHVILEIDVVQVVTEVQVRLADDAVGGRRQTQ